MSSDRFLVTRLRAAGCVFAEDEADLLAAAAPTQGELAALVERRVGGAPLEVILGWAEFYGLRITITAGVFVPRKRSEFLVQRATALGRPGAVVVELCCGTGAIGAATLRQLGTGELHAADIDPVAVRCARANLASLDADAGIHEGDLYGALPATLRGRVELLIVNAPYVPTSSIAHMPPEAREHEPRRALDGGTDGVNVQRRVAAEAREWLAPGGHLLIETGEEQASRTVEAMSRYGLTTHVAHNPDLDATVVTGTAH